MAFLIAWCATVIALQWQASLLPAALLIALFFLSIIFLYASWQSKPAWLWRSCAGLLLGIVYANTFAVLSLSQVLPSELERQELSLTVSIENIPEQKGLFQRSRVKIVGGDFGKARNLQLDWYGDEVIKPCETWQIIAKLKRPHGLRNPNTWSFRQYALEQHIHAMGYVKSAKKVADKKFCLQSFRAAWQEYLLETLPAEQAAWLIALSIGEKTYLSDEQYQLLQAFGINHLFVISGLHIGLSASVVFFLLMLLRRSGLGLIWQGDWRFIASVLAMLAALVYTALANFAIPAQRALLMLFVFFAVGLWGVRWSSWLRFFLAMAVVLLLNPFAAMNLGFALSFAAVAILIVCANQWQQKTIFSKCLLLLRAQFAIAVGLSPLLLLYFSQVSVFSPLINLIAIPYISFLVVPLLLSALLLWLITADDMGLLYLADQTLSQMFDLLVCLQRYADQVIAWGQGWYISNESFVLLSFAALLLIVLRFFIWRWQAVFLALLALLCLPSQQRLQQGELHIAFLDVGQGLSVLIRTQHHAMLYDVGAAWPQGSMAKQVVLPVLQYYGVKHLDAVMISHFDNDHAGGWRQIQREIMVKRWQAPSDKPPFTFCQQGMTWQWDEVEFSILSPSRYFTGSDNDGSCVLLISAAGKQVLLTGDIGKQQEIRISQEKNFPSIDVLQAGHHGSNTSSSYALLSKMPAASAHVVYSSGYLNSYGHPHSKVVGRFTHYGVQQWNTAQHGLVEFFLLNDSTVKVHAFRQQQARYWDDVLVNHLEY